MDALDVRLHAIEIHLGSVVLRFAEQRPELCVARGWYREARGIQIDVHAENRLSIWF